MDSWNQEDLKGFRCTFADSNIVKRKKSNNKDCYKEFFVCVNYDFLELIGAEFIEGRNFSQEFSTDQMEAIVVNEAAVKALELDESIGKFVEGVYAFENPGKIIGVIKDMHYRSLHMTVDPIIFFLGQWYIKTERIVVKIRPDNVLPHYHF